MSKYDRILPDLLSRYRDDPAPDEGDARSDSVRAAMLVVASSSAEDLRTVQHIGYDTFVDEEGNQTTGLSLSSYPCLVLDVFDAMVDMKVVPPEVASRLEGIEKQEFEAAIFAVRCLLHALNRTPYTDLPDEGISDQRTASLLAAYVRQIHHFARTGEP